MLNPACVSRLSNAIFFGHQTKSFSVRLAAQNIFPVVSLLAPRNPRAILGKISKAVISTFNRQFVSVAVRHCPVSKGGKIFPLWAHGNPLGHIEFIGSCIGVSASLNHAPPDSVNAGVGFSRRVSVRNRLASSDFNTQAATRLRVSIAEFLARHGSFVAAITGAFPHRAAVASAPNLFNDEQASETLSSKVHKFSHGQSNTVFQTYLQVIDDNKFHHIEGQTA